MNNKGTINWFKLNVVLDRMQLLPPLILLFYLWQSTPLEALSIQNMCTISLYFFLAIFLYYCIFSIASIKQYGLEKSSVLLIANLAINSFFKSLLFTAAFFIGKLIFSLNLDFFIQVILMQAVAVAAFVPGLFFFYPFYFKRVKNLFNRVERRQDLEERFKALMKKTTVNARIYQIRKGFYRISNMMAMPPTNEIIILGRTEKILSKKELEAVVVHELLHLKSSRKILRKALLFIGGYLLVVNFLLYHLLWLFESIYLYLGIPLLLPGISIQAASAIFTLTVIAVSVAYFVLYSLKSARKQEKKIDKKAIKLVDSRTYISSMKKLNEYNKIPEMGRLQFLNTHPERSEREKI